MRSQTIRALLAAGLLSAGAAGGLIVQAAEPATVAVTTNRQTGVLPAPQRASQIMGLTVRNAENKDLGTINDVVLDPTEGRVRYYAVSYGGWLGLGDKLFAVPPTSFAWKTDDNGNNYLVLNLSEERLKAAPGFNQDNWPDFATDSQWREKIETYYRVEKVEVRRQ